MRYSTDLLTSQALGYLRRQADSRRPFFLSVAYLAPHFGKSSTPSHQRCAGSARPAARYRGRFERLPLPRTPSFDERNVSDKPAAIRALPRFSPGEIASITRDYHCRSEALLSVDDGVASIVEMLQRLDVLGRTIVIFTSDNGYFQGQHRVPRGKIRVYEPSVRVPLLVRGPGFPRGETVESPTANVDLAPTIVDAAHARPGRVMDGVSLARVAQRPDAYRNRAIVLESGPEDGPDEPQYRALRSDRWKYVEYVTGERELYDLRADPDELRNRAYDPAYRDVRTWLARQLAARADCRGSGCRRPLRRPAWVGDPVTQGDDAWVDPLRAPFGA